MANSAANVEVAVTGAVHYAPAGTTLPTDATTALPAAFLEAGFIDDNGLTRSHSTSTNDIQAWQNSAVVRTVVSKDTLTFKFAMLETNPVTQQIYYGAPPDAATGAVAGKGGQGIRGVWVFDVIDGDKLERIVVPDGQVTAWDDIAYKSTDATVYGVTVTGYPDAADNSDYKYSTVLEAA